jgi:hypothetical protein
MANVEEAAIGLSGRISLNGLLPSPGPVKRIVEGDERRGAAGVAGITLRGAGLVGAPIIGTATLGKCAGWEFAGGGAFRAISPVEPLLSGLASGLSESADDGVVTAEDGPIGATLAAGLSGAALRWVAGISECDSAVAAEFTPGVSVVSAAGGVGVREVLSRRLLSSACEV